jgi:hypothetical protein
MRYYCCHVSFSDYYINNSAEEIDMKSETLQQTLQILARVFENSAEKAQIEEFKAKYSGVLWYSGIERSLLTYARSRPTMERWIENLINFMEEKNIMYNV